MGKHTWFAIPNCALLTAYCFCVLELQLVDIHFWLFVIRERLLFFFVYFISDVKLPFYFIYPIFDSVLKISYPTHNIIIEGPESRTGRRSKTRTSIVQAVTSHRTSISF